MLTPIPAHTAPPTKKVTFAKRLAAKGYKKGKGKAGGKDAKGGKECAKGNGKKNSKGGGSKGGKGKADKGKGKGKSKGKAAEMLMRPLPHTEAELPLDAPPAKRSKKSKKDGAKKMSPADVIMHEWATIAIAQALHTASNPWISRKAKSRVKKQAIAIYANHSSLAPNHPTVAIPMLTLVNEEVKAWLAIQQSQTKAAAALPTAAVEIAPKTPERLGPEEKEADDAPMPDAKSDGSSTSSSEEEAGGIISIKAPEAWITDMVLTPMEDKQALVMLAQLRAAIRRGNLPRSKFAFALWKLQTLTFATFGVHQEPLIANKDAEMEAAEPEAAAAIDTTAAESEPAAVVEAPKKVPDATPVPVKKEPGTD